MRTLAVIAFIFIIVPLLLLAAGQFGLLKGRPPSEPGLREGKLKPPSRTQNSVSSQASLWPAADYAVEYGDRAARVHSGLGARDESAARRAGGWPGAHIIENSPEYISVQFETRWLRFVDDAEFLLDLAARVIHVRSASRIGRKDFEQSRKNRSDSPTR